MSIVVKFSSIKFYLKGVGWYDARNIFWEHLTFAAKPKIGARSQESGGKRKKEEGTSQNKCFYKYEMIPIFWQCSKF
ncbi:hypothetical protein D0A37_13545 [Microcoleus vaginatus HSN003]|nr:hypothetical protein D0A37_13545 [Microcoleus vaginatus HSN003]